MLITGFKVRLFRLPCAGFSAGYPKKISQDTPWAWVYGYPVLRRFRFPDGRQVGKA